jgi:aryl-alcohol dehydrogenase-like predicted oxidoreductase
MYNLLKRQAEVEILPMAAAEGLGVTTYNPLAAGLLTGKYGAIAWAAAHPAVTAPVLGARTMEQLDECLGAADIEMTAELRESFSALSPAPPPATDRTDEAGPHRHAARS